MVKNVLKSGDERLRKPSKPVKKIDKKIKNLIKNLKDTLKVQKDPEGVGLAAPQIGKNYRLFVMVDNKKVKTIINPEVLDVSEEKLKEDEAMEGCLSIPHYYAPLKRANKIKIKYMDEEGEEKKETFKGFSAQIVQHEIDHLDGKLFIDRLLKQKKPLYKFNKNGEWEEVDFANI